MLGNTQLDFRVRLSFLMEAALTTGMMVFRREVSTGLAPLAAR